MNQAYSRRKFIKKYMYVGSVFVSGSLILSGCSQEKKAQEEKKNAAPVDACTDFSGVSENDMKARQKLGYVKESPMPDMKCNNCNLWLPPPAGITCGKCMILKGPVYSSAYCTYWAPQV